MSALRPAFLEAAGARPRGWDDLWAAFVCVIREPVEEPEILGENVWLEIVPANPRYSPHPRAVLSRRVRLRGGRTDNNLEASLAVTAFWTPAVDVGQRIVTITGRGTSSDDDDPELPLDEFVATVVRHPTVAVLRAADADLDRWVAEYAPPEELD